MTRGAAEPVAIVCSSIRPEERGLFEAFARRGVPAVHVDDRRLVFRPGHRPNAVPDLVLNRSISATRRRYVSRLFEAEGKRVLNSAAVVETCDDKVLTTIALNRAGLPVPDTAISVAPDAGLDAVQAVGFPAVLKPVVGSWGRLVSRVTDLEAARALLDHRAHLPGPQHRVAYAQAYVDKPGRDIRVVAVGDQPIGAIYRSAESWLTNTARGAASSRCRLTPELAELAARASRAVGGGFLGIDLLESPDGAVFVSEVNSTVQLSGFVEQWGTAVFDEVVEHALGIRS